MAQSVTRKEYNKQIQRLKREIKKVQKLGYDIPLDILPEIPKRITRKKVEELQAIKSSDIRKIKMPTSSSSVDESTSYNIVSLTKNSVNARQRKIASVGTDNYVPKPRKVAKPKEQISAEELHQRRVEAGRKAYQTKIKGMSAEELQAWKVQQGERLQKGRIRKAKETQVKIGKQISSTKANIPTTVSPNTYDIIDAIRSVLQEKTNFVNESVFPFGEQKSSSTRRMSALQVIFETVVTEASSSNSIDELRTFYTVYEEELKQALDSMWYASDGKVFESPDIEVHYTRAAVILRNHVALTLEEASDLSDFIDSVVE